METDALQWYCLRSQPKRENIAAKHLRTLLGLEVFAPRIRFRRRTRLGWHQVTEALFPNYLFARFNAVAMLTRVKYSTGISGIVHFGAKWATLPECEVQRLQAHMQNDELCEIKGEIGVGDQVQLAETPFLGLAGVVTQLLPARERVKVLLEFLGGQHEIEIGARSVVAPMLHPLTY